MTQVITDKGIRRRLFFEGDSLSELGNTNQGYVYQFPYYCYSLLTHTGLSVFPFAVSGSKIQPGVANSITDRIGQITAMARPNDIAFVLAGTNDISINGRTAAQVYADLCAYGQLLRDEGILVVVGTMIAKDRTGDDAAAVELIRLDYNNLIRGNSIFTFDGIADFGALTQFDSVADCSVAANYQQSDKVHLTQVGYQLLGTAGAPPIQALL